MNKPYTQYILEIKREKGGINRLYFINP